MLLGSLLLVVALGVVLTSCGGGSNQVLPSVRTGQSFIVAEVRADNTQALLPAATLSVGASPATGDGTGKFELAVAPGASYRLTATAAGFASQTRTVAVPSAMGLASSVTQVIIYLSPALPVIPLDPAGGDVDAGNGIVVRVPAGAVAARIDATLTVESLTAAGGGTGSAGSLVAVLGKVELLPAGTAFAVPVQVIIPRAFLKIVNALVGAGATFELWESNAGGFALAGGTVTYRSGSDDFVVSLPQTGSFQIRAGVTIVPVSDLRREVGEKLTTTTGGSIAGGTVTYDFSTSSSSADPALNAILTGTYGVAPGVNLSAPNPPIVAQDGFIVDATPNQTGQRVNIISGGTSLGTVDFYGTQVVMVAAVRPPPRTGTG